MLNLLTCFQCFKSFVSSVKLPDVARFVCWECQPKGFAQAVALAASTSTCDIHNL